METENFDELMEDMDALLEEFDGELVEGGVDPAEDDDSCPGGACKL